MHPTAIPPAETAAERTQRHVRQCQRLAELGMQLAEAAAARAAQAFASQASDPEQADQPQRQRTVHPATLFNQLASAVRQAIRLECRLVAGHAETLASRTQADPRRAKIRRAIRAATTDSRDRRFICNRADELLEAELALDPDGTASLPDLLDVLCEDLGIHLDFDELASSLESPEPAIPGHADPNATGAVEWPSGPPH